MLNRLLISTLCRTCVFCVSCFLSTISPLDAAQVKVPDDAVSITIKEQKNSASFYLSSKRTIESTVTFRCKVANLRSSHALPYTFVVHGPQQGTEILRFQRDKADCKWGFGRWSYRNRFGMASQLKTVDYPYALPYSHNERHKVTQGFFGSYSHSKGFPDQYAIDFQMKEGTVVRASRPGIVIAYRDDSNVGGDTIDFQGCENYVVIKHGDGTYGMYSHLKQHGVLVKLGQSVQEGSKLGLAGATGWAGKPHLHFSVYRVKDGLFIDAVKFHMKKAGVLLPELKEGRTY